jgi:multidrug efflux system membrane fusion protein
VTVTRWTAQLIGLLWFLTLAACSEDAGKKKSEAPPVPVTTATAQEKSIPVTLKVVGRAEAFESVTLKSRVDGQVTSVLFTEGQHVKKGDVLLRLDPTDYEARLQQAAANSARDTALLAKTRADTARYIALRERNFVSDEKVNEVRTNEAAATANLRASKAAEETARLQLSYTTLRAPFDGVVGARVVFSGTTIKANDTALAVVNRIRPLLVSFSIPEKHLPRLREALKESAGGMKVDLTLPDDDTRHFDGTVRFLDNAVDTTTGTILMKAELPNADEQLTPGQFLNVTLLLETLHNAVTVPDEAVQQGADSNFVYVVNKDQRAEVRKVETATSEDGVTAIRKGLHTGETIVTEGQVRLTPGSRIKTVNPGENAGKAGASETPATPPAK